MKAHDKLIALGRRKDKRWRAHCEALQAELARLHPATGGHIGLVHNWGNPAAREALARSWIRWRKFSDKCEAMGRELIRQHIKGF